MTRHRSRRTTSTAVAAALASLMAFGLALPARAAEVLAQGSLPASFGLRFGPDGLLYVCTFGGVAVLDVTAGQMVGLYGPEHGVLGPEDVNFGPDGSMYWAAMFTGEVGRLAPDGTVTTQVVGPGVNPIAFSADGRMFVSEPWMSDTLLELDPQLEAPPTVLAQGLGGVKGADFGPDGLLYAALMWQGKVVAIDLDAEPVTVTTVAEGVPSPFTAKFGPDGMLYVIERVGFTIQRMDPTSGARSTYATLPFGPDNLAFNAQGRLFVSSYTDGLVAEVFPDGSHAVYVPGGLTLVSGIAVLPRADGGESVWVGNLFSLREYDGATGAERSVTRYRWTPGQGFGGAVSVAADGGELVLTNFFPAGMGRVQRWDPATAAVVEDHFEFPVPVNAIALGDDLVVIDLGMAAGEARVLRVGAGGTEVLADSSDQVYLPLGLAAAGGNLWLGDWATGVIWQLAAGGQELPQPLPIANGLLGPEGLAVDNDGTLLVVEAGAGRVSRVNPSSGVVTPVVSGLALGLQGFGTLPPFGTLTGIAVGPSGAVYVAGDAGLVVYKLVPQTAVVAAAANSAGLAGSHWSTDLELHNRGSVMADITVHLLERGHDNSAPRTVALSLGPGLSARYPNVLESLFDTVGAAALRVTSFGGDLLVSSRTGTRCGNGRCSAYATAADAGEAAGRGEALHMTHLENNATARTNLGVVNLAGVPATVEVELFAADGTALGDVVIALEPFGYRQIEDLFASLDEIKVEAWRLETVADAFAVARATTPGAAIVAYAAVIDNSSNDAYLVPAR